MAPYTAGGTDEVCISLAEEHDECAHFPSAARRTHLGALRRLALGCTQADCRSRALANSVRMWARHAEYWRPDICAGGRGFLTRFDEYAELLVKMVFNGTNEAGMKTKSSRSGVVLATRTRRACPRSARRRQFQHEHRDHDCLRRAPALRAQPCIRALPDLRLRGVCGEAADAGEAVLGWLGDDGNLGLGIVAQLSGLRRRVNSNQRTRLYYQNWRGVERTSRCGMIVGGA